jgi:hypothetical protein
MTDPGVLVDFLGIEVDYRSDGLFLSHTKYESSLLLELNRAGLTENQICENPLEMNIQFRPAEGKPLPDPTMYRKLVRSLNYLTIKRPEGMLLMLLASL